jgi:hypothetical protein
MCLHMYLRIVILLTLASNAGCSSTDFHHGGLYMRNDAKSIPVTTDKHPQETAITIAPNTVRFNFKF